MSTYLSRDIMKKFMKENIFQVLCIENQEQNQLIENKLNSYKWQFRWLLKSRIHCTSVYPEQLHGS